jgi:hypothetical protein
MNSYFGELDNINPLLLSTNNILENIYIIEIFDKKYKDNLEQTKIKLYESFIKKITYHLELLVYNPSYKIVQDENIGTLGLLVFKKLDDFVLNRLEMFKIEKIEKIINLKFIIFEKLLETILKFYNLVLKEEINKNINSLESLHFLVGVSNDLIHMISNIEEKIFLTEFNNIEKSKLKNLYLKIKLFSDKTLEEINSKICEMLMNNLIVSIIPKKNTNKPISKRIIKYLTNYFVLLEFWMRNENYSDLLEKINIKFKNSQLFDNNNCETIKFEEFIQEQFDNLYVK